MTRALSINADTQKGAADVAASKSEPEVVKTATKKVEKKNGCLDNHFILLKTLS